MKVLALFLMLLLPNCSKPGTPPDLAVYTGQGFQLINVESKSTRLIPCSVPVGSFSIAPNGKFLVFASTESRPGMGQIYRLDFETSQIRKLTSAAFNFTSKLFPHPAFHERELYSDVEVSPDSQSVAFAVRSVADNDSDDLVGLSGPLAVMELLSGKVRILSSTEKVDGEGPAFANSPRWSNDGKKLLLAFEFSGAITSTNGDTLQWFDRHMLKPFDEGQVSPKGWWSNKEIGRETAPIQLTLRFTQKGGGCPMISSTRSIKTAIFLAGFASERTQQIGPFTQLPGPGFFVV